MPISICSRVVVNNLRRSDGRVKLEMVAKKERSGWYWWVILAGVNALVVAGGWIFPVKLLIFFLTEVAVIMIWDKRKDDGWWLLMAGIIGPGVEVVAICGGAWSYSVPFVLGVPIWLPLLWGLSGLLARRMVEGLK
ncbi:MAG: hypothetical protein UX91_C0007G0039 [Candidatus Amesbacteria bacterium GW2011_GWB1_47_19]|nr:MAG: hypothetical protein UW51_C0006G0140 [Candidatus Amesbacteria bacterium GW2011_GWA1_44_24]KKU31823.1 MAG: hypothetical protein UX46_C0002G0039 [Candidatus Amesbacteria bacterium GW2011_GWC1_46_24]KKU66759.1 MAG: hypothetical protein UX91_C0007G0039 [Candidatus Amesbacteria bacterium GW2011_GWB1_47_19]